MLGAKKVFWILTDDTCYANIKNVKKYICSVCVGAELSLYVLCISTQSFSEFWEVFTAFRKGVHQCLVLGSKN